MQNQTLSPAEKFKAAFYLVFTVLAFSSIEIMVSPVRNDIPPMLMNFWRFCIGTLILLPFMMATRYRQLKQLAARDMLYMALLGSLNIILLMGAHAVCIKYAKASTAAVLIAANPLATNFFSWLLFKEKMPPGRISALILGLFGIIILTFRADTAIDTPLGMAAGIVAMAGFGLYTVLSKKLIAKHDSLTVLVMSSLPALILYLPLLHFLQLGFWPPTHTWPNILGAGIFGTGLGYLTFMKALAYLSAGRASYLFFFKPPVAIFLAWLLLGEKIAVSAILGTMMIMAGILTEIWRAAAINGKLSVSNQQ